MTKSPPPTPPASGRGVEPLLAPLPLAGGVGGGPGSGQFKPRNTSRAKELRNNATTAERALWSHLSQRQRSGHKFSRQMPVGPYFADFLCREAGLIVEVDGFSHEARQDYDARRDTFLKQQGFRIVRFTNDDVRDNLEGVVAAIDIALGETNSPPAPPASARGENHAYLQGSEMKPTLTIRTPDADSAPAIKKKGRGWEISEKRLDALHERARELRRNPTPAQDALAAALGEANTGGYSFRRQQVIGSAIVDFACKPLMLVLELDGDEDAAFAADRDRSLAEVGYRVERLAAADVLADPQAAAARVVEVMRERWHERKSRARVPRKPQPERT